MKRSGEASAMRYSAKVGLAVRKWRFCMPGRTMLHMVRARLTVLALAALLITAAVPDCMAQVQANADAMTCCRSMPCTPANRSQDCCKKMVQIPNVFSPAPARTNGAGSLVQLGVAPPTRTTARDVTPLRRAEVKQHSPPGELFTLHQSLRI